MEQPLSKQFAFARTNLCLPRKLGVLLALFAITGCQRVQRTADPQLKPIQEMLDSQLPMGTPEANVLTYLNNRGYPVLAAGKQGTVVTTIRHIDPQTVTPVTARVTFYFDANSKLNTYELERTFNEAPKVEQQQVSPAPNAGQPQGQPTQP